MKINYLLKENKGNIVLLFVIHLLLYVGIIIWFIICAFGWVVPIALQNDGCNTILQLISFIGWLIATVEGIYQLAKNTKFSFF